MPERRKSDAARDAEKQALLWRLVGRQPSAKEFTPINALKSIVGIHFSHTPTRYFTLDPRQNSMTPSFQRNDIKGALTRADHLSDVATLGRDDILYNPYLSEKDQVALQTIWELIGRCEPCQKVLG